MCVLLGFYTYEYVAVVGSNGTGAPGFGKKKKCQVLLLQGDHSK